MELWQTLRSNWPIKLAAFLVGITLWFHVKTDQTYERVVPIPLQVMEQSGRFVVANEVPPDVKVRIVGTGKNLLFRSHHGRLVVRPRVTRREAITVDLSPEQIEGIDQNSGFEAVGIDSPSSILLDFDYFDTREVPVIPRVGIVPRPGYAVVGRITTDPHLVRVGGPRRYVRDIESVKTDSVVITDVGGEVARAVPVALPEGRNLQSAPQKVVIRADVQVLLERQFASIPVTITHVPRGQRAQAIPEAVSVSVIGGDRVINAMNAKQIKVRLDYRQRFEKGLDDLPLEVTLPRYVRLVQVNPPVASLVTVRRSRRR